MNGFPCYEKAVVSTGSSSKRVYECLSHNKSSPFIEYKGMFIRKTTALYLVQEKVSLSSDRLLRVRRDQLSHIFSEADIENSIAAYLRCGELVIFRTVDNPKNLMVGRIVQFSYLFGSKKQRQYSSSYVDLQRDSKTNIGVLCNWYQSKCYQDRLHFQLSDLYTIGYVSMENYSCTVPDSILIPSTDEGYLFSVLTDNIKRIVQDWKNII